MDSVVTRFDDLQSILEASSDELASLKGVGPSRARCILEGLQRLRDFDLVERER